MDASLNDSNVSRKVDLDFDVIFFVFLTNRNYYYINHNYATIFISVNYNFKFAVSFKFDAILQFYFCLRYLAQHIPTDTSCTMLPLQIFGSKYTNGHKLHDASFAAFFDLYFKVCHCSLFMSFYTSSFPKIADDLSAKMRLNEVSF